MTIKKDRVFALCTSETVNSSGPFSFGKLKKSRTAFCFLLQISCSVGTGNVVAIIDVIL